MPKTTSLFAMLALSALAAAQDPAPKPAPKPDAPKTESPKAEAPKALAIGDQLPKGMSLRGLDGKIQRFDDLKGKVVVLHFWSSTCPWEVLAEPKLNALADEFAGKDVVVLGIAANANEIGEPPTPEAFDDKDADKRPYPKLRAKAAESKANHPILVDHDAVFGKLLDAKTTPHCFVFDKDLVLQYQGALDDDGQGKKPSPTRYAHDAVTALLAGDKPAVQTTKPYG
jgi:thiol-disulfide isomerase/thioredoxin